MADLPTTNHLRIVGLPATITVASASLIEAFDLLNEAAELRNYGHAEARDQEHRAREILERILDGAGEATHV